MTRRSGSRFKIYLPLMCLLVLALACPASAEWKEKVLHSFQGNPDAATPTGGVVFDKAGNLYGAALGGPQYSQGTVFQLAPPAKKGDPWTESVLYVFQGKPVNDGQIPTGGLIIDSAGNLYGVTGYGGTGACVLLGNPVGCGTVYEISPPKEKGSKWAEKILYSFKGGKDGYFPDGTLVFDSAGNLFGATDYGGGYGICNAPYYQYCGTIFELSPPAEKGGKWKEKVLYSFKSGTDGANPNGGLVLKKTGEIYGTTLIGGYNCPHHSGQGCGTVFELDPPAVKDRPWTEKQVHIFKDGADGAQPIAGVILDAAGSLYGASQGGTNGCGVVFSLTANSRGLWKNTVLYSFGGGEYYYSPAASQFDASGNLYGTTNVGPGSLAGSVFRLKPPSRGGTWTASVLYGFKGAPDPTLPNADLVFDKKGNLYGTTTKGGSGTGCSFDGCGTVFEVSPQERDKTHGSSTAVNRFSLTAYPSQPSMKIGRMLVIRLQSVTALFKGGDYTQIHRLDFRGHQ